MTFSSYQKFVIAVLAFLQFTVIVDFLIISPLGAFLIPLLKIGPNQLTNLVSVYAFSAGVSGLLTAGFADRFDRKRLLLFFYVGFLVGTALCGVANNYYFLFFARLVTGLFGGVIGSVSMAIAADLFPMEVRGRAMGIIQTAFAVSQIAGIPLGLYLCNWWGWHAPFLALVGIGAIAGFIIAAWLRPIDAHLRVKHDRDALGHLLHTASKPAHIRGFCATVLLATGGFMMIPLGSTFTVNNLGISARDLPLIYLYTGIFSIISGPLFGRLSDKLGKYPVFFAGTLLAMAMVTIYCHLGVTPLWAVVLVNILLFTAILARMVSSSALISGVPEMQDRGAFMSINASLQQFAGGLAALAAGRIVIQDAVTGKLERYDILGYVVVGAMTATLILMYSINLLVKRRMAGTSVAQLSVQESSDART